MTTVRAFLIVSLTAGCLALTPTATRAEEEHGHEQAKEEPHFKVIAPATVKEAWMLITMKVAEAEKHLAANKVEPVHEIGEQLEAAVHALNDKSDIVAESNMTKLASALKQLDKAVDDLHHAAEDNDLATAGLQLRKIQGLLPLVKGLYPEGALQ